MKYAFSLVELSIVLVILGLLTGGILGGQSLIRAAELRSLSTDAARYTTAVYTFRDKYFALPGDMTNATKFWGAAPDCNAQSASGAATCDGNGDGVMTWSGTYPERAEIFTLWQHLANAGLIEGTYNGVRGPGIYAAATTPGINSPRTRISNGCWTAFNNVGSTSFNLTTATRTNAFLAGGLGGSGADPDYCHAAFIKPEELWNIDTKMDDGRPGQGSIVTWNQTRSPNCATTNDPATAAYNLGYTINECALIQLLR